MDLCFTTGRRKGQFDFGEVAALSGCRLNVGANRVEKVLVRVMLPISQIAGSVVCVKVTRSIDVGAHAGHVDDVESTSIDVGVMLDMLTALRGPTRHARLSWVFLSTIAVPLEQ